MRTILQRGGRLTRAACRASAAARLVVVGVAFAGCNQPERADDATVGEVIDTLDDTPLAPDIEDAIADSPSPADGSAPDGHSDDSDVQPDTSTGGAAHFERRESDPCGDHALLPLTDDVLRYFGGTLHSADAANALPDIADLDRSAVLVQCDGSWCPRVRRVIRVSATGNLFGGIEMSNGDVVITAWGPSGITRLDADGDALWRRTQAGARPMVEVPDASGDVIAIMAGASGDGPRLSALARIRADGTIAWLRDVRGGEQEFRLVFVRDQLWLGERFYACEATNPCASGFQVIDPATGRRLACHPGPAGGERSGLLQNYERVVEDETTVITFRDRELAFFDVTLGVERIVPLPEVDLPAEYPEDLAGAAAPVRTPEGWVLATTQYLRLLGHDGAWEATSANYYFAAGGVVYDAPTVDHSGRLWLATDGGIMSFTANVEIGLMEPRPGWPTWRPVHSPIVLRDGAMLMWHSRTLAAFDPDEMRILWQLDMFDDVFRPPIARDDGSLVVVDKDGHVAIIDTDHGGLANTPAPRSGFDNGYTYHLPTGPFATEPERDASWR